MGLIFHNSIPMRPEKGPFPAHYSDSNHYALAFTPSEEVRLLCTPAPPPKTPPCCRSPLGRLQQLCSRTPQEDPSSRDRETNACRTALTPTPQVLLLALKLVGIGFWSLTISKIIKSVTTLSNPASVAYAQVRLSHESTCTCTCTRPRERERGRFQY